MNISEPLQTGLDVKGVSQPSPTVQSPEINKPEKIQSEVSPKKTEPTEKGSPPKLSREETEELVEALEDLATTIQTKLNFSINETTNDIVVKIIDKDTDTIIRQFPSEELLELQEKMIDLAGFLFNTDA
ncbi:MAG: flagellar protein FlaG [Desulfobacterales bacterium]|nr:flagellar protein FlaG [Desulfobacterales bacterium]